MGEGVRAEDQEESIKAGEDQNEQSNSPSRRGASSGTEEGQIKSDADDEPKDLSVILTLEPHHVMIPVGVVSSVLITQHFKQATVAVTVKHKPVDIGSVLWITETRTPLGRVDGYYGSVLEHDYSVRMDSESQQPVPGTQVSLVEEFAERIGIAEMKFHQRFYVKSPPGEYEFSDKEKEAEYKRARWFRGKRHMSVEHGEETNSLRKKKKYKKTKSNTQRAPVPQHQYQNPMLSQTMNQQQQQITRPYLGVQESTWFPGFNQASLSTAAMFMGSNPNKAPYQASMFNQTMNQQQHQITRPNFGGQGSTSYSGLNHGSLSAAGKLMLINPIKAPYQAPRMQMVNPGLNQTMNLQQQQITRPNFGGQGSTSFPGFNPASFSGAAFLPGIPLSGFNPQTQPQGFSNREGGFGRGRGQDQNQVEAEDQHDGRGRGRESRGQRGRSK